MTKMEGNENFCVFEMKTMDIMLYIYDINIVEATNCNEIFCVFEIQYNIVTHCIVLSPIKKKPCDQNMIAGGCILTDMAAFLEKAAQEPRNALNSILGVYTTDPLVAVSVGALCRFVSTPSFRIPAPF